MTLPPLVIHDDPLPAGFEDPAGELGGKGMSLRWLHERGIRVPRGFTIRAEVCRRFLAHGGWPDGVWQEVVAAVCRIEQQAGRPLRLAVRGGAAVSMPGQLRTHLDVAVDLSSCATNRSTIGDCAPLRSAIEDVFQSWNSAAALQYRELRGIDDAMGTAVTVQEMIACTASGVMFTQSPETDDNSLTIEAVSGYAAALVSGQETPYRCILDRKDARILCGAGHSDSLTHLVDRLPELCRIGLQLEEVHGEPLDVEWGYDRDGFVFFQVRPVVLSCDSNRTAHPHSRNELESNTRTVDGSSDQNREEFIQTERARLRQLADDGAICWVRHNLSETLPYPTPLTWSLWQSFMSGSGGLGTLYRRLGYHPGSRASEGFLTLIGGRIYADPDRAADMFGNGYPLTYDVDELRRNPSALDQAPRHFDPLRLDPFFLWRLPFLGWRLWRTQRRIARQFETAARRFEADVVPAFLGRLDQERTITLADQSTDELLTTFADRRRLVMDEFGPESLLPAMLGGIACSELTRQARHVLGPEAASHLVDDLVPAGDVELSRRQQKLFASLSHDTGRTAFLKEFGHRAVGEMELAVPRWRETPDDLVALSGKPTCDDDTVKPLDRMAGREHLRKSFTDAGAASLISSAAYWFDRCWELLPYRDRGKHLFLMGYELLREVTEVLAGRFVLGDDFYFVKAGEWQELLAGADILPTIECRRFEAEIARRLHVPAFIDAEHLDDIFSESTTLPDTEVQRGTPLVGGRGVGVVRSLAALSDRHSGDVPTVLVCEALEPAQAPLLARVVAVVVERGGGLSHSAILARQFGIPMVRMTDATQLLRDGVKVLVDGRTGQIEIVSEVPA